MIYHLGVMASAQFKSSNIIKVKNANLIGSYSYDPYGVFQMELFIRDTIGQMELSFIIMERE